jgi:hypothetical protein
VRFYHIKGRPRGCKFGWRTAGTGREGPDAELVANVLRRENVGGDHLALNSTSSRSACVFFVSVARALAPCTYKRKTAVDRLRIGR